MEVSNGKAEMIPAGWTTTRLVVRDVSPEEEPQARRLYLEAGPLPQWTGRAAEEGYVRRWLAGDPDVPPGGSPDRVRLQAAWLADVGGSERPAAILELFHGYPGPDDLYIGYFGVDAALRGTGIGRELVEGIAAQAQALGYRKARAAVDLKNWAGLRFWIAVGFVEAVKVGGDAVYGPDAFARIELARSL
ncbi:GNAT family N-acetyltransferase [Paenibacillus albicereus]|uniref:GNAT family N-acetyltransferase n=1 Tax=Paenibacillus albicereus TaxID=2726185 RepID=A0A6H2GTM7_9BACL|nr:GNAT family N-acetyltransferase [Paenibacillus albicereus]QJC50784.1 GNAT family N-acetyltransferase [Paenibacillus albicereus]